MSRIIIGAGECGVRAAFALREQGFEGDITLIGEELSLPYERPPLSKNLESEAKPIRAREAYEAAGIDLRLESVAVRVDPANRQVQLAEGRPLAYDQLLLATGARARLFPGMDGCLTLRSDADARAIMALFRPGARIGIVGGGFIGLELAATARKAGADVELFEAGPRLLGRAVPEAIARFVHERHEGEGVIIRIAANVANADADSIALGDGSRHAFDAVIAGVGALPNTDLAEQAGLEVDNGVLVDGHFRSSDPHIFAAGDCCNFPWRGGRIRLESWRAAQDQGEHVAAAMLGQTDSYAEVPWFWSDQYDLTLQVAGLFDSALPIHTRATPEDSAIVFQLDGSGTLSAAAGIGPGNAIAKDLRIFEKLIERQAEIAPDILADPAQKLQRLLRMA